MTPDELLRSNDVVAALSALKLCVREKPEDTKLRTFLFQMFAVLGEYDKAFNQLSVLAELDPSTIPMVQTYKTLLPSEAFRAEVFSGEHMPSVFNPPLSSGNSNTGANSADTDTSSPYMQPLLLSLRQWVLKRANNQKLDVPLALSQQAMAAAPALAGSINGDKFNWVMDGDSRMGPALEVVIKGKYYWLPFQNIRSIQCEAPEDLRDMVWFPAHFTWHSGEQVIGFIPVRYPETLAHSDPRFWLAKQTDWQSPAQNYFLGVGQRTLITDNSEYPLLELRDLEFNPPESQLSAVNSTASESDSPTAEAQSQ